MNFLSRKHLTDATAVDLNEPLELRILRHRLRLIDQLLEEYGGDDAVVPAAGTYAYQEHKGLVADLQAQRRITVAAIATDSSPNLKLRERNEGFLDREERNALETKRSFLERLLREGDYRQHRLHVIDMLDVRANAAKTFGLKD